jgi:carbonic anhydrase/acetyltransferase-like protein (isoleucine patch superfamily)
MSIPSSLTAGPFVSLVLIKKRYLIFYIYLIWVSIFSIQLEFWWYWDLLFEWKFIQFITFLPLLIFLMYLTLVFVSLLNAKLLLVIVNLIHKPNEGVFMRKSNNKFGKDYRYWCMRSVIKRWPIWLSHKFPLPFLDNICFKLFGIRTKYSNSLFEAWVDTEFIEFGKEVVLGQGSIIQSSVIMGNLLIIQKTIIEDNVKIGAHSVVMPGTMISKNAILAASSMTTVGQELEEGWIYLGVPAKKFKENVFYEENLEEIIEKQMHDVEEIRLKYEKLYTKRHDKDL